MNTYNPEAHAAGLTDSELAEMLDTVPASSLGSPLHAALVAESHARAAKAEAAEPTHTPGFIGTVRGSGRIEYFSTAEVAALWSDNAVVCMVPAGPDIITSRP